jgi:hypothetical protein
MPRARSAPPSRRSSTRRAVEARAPECRPGGARSRTCAEDRASGNPRCLPVPAPCARPACGPERWFAPKVNTLVACRRRNLRRTGSAISFRGAERGLSFLCWLPGIQRCMRSISTYCHSRLDVHAGGRRRSGLDQQAARRSVNEIEPIVCHRLQFAPAAKPCGSQFIGR